MGAALLIILAGGTVYAFGAYSEALKATLELSQAQLELAALCGNLGNYLGTAGFFYDRFGGVASVKFGALLIGVGYGCQWLLATWGSTYAIELLCACCFVWGHGSGYLDCAAVGSGVAAFPRRRGAVVGLLKSFYGLASSMIILALPWLGGIDFIAALAVVAGGLPLLALYAFEDAPDRAGKSDALDALAGRTFTSLAGRVVAFSLLALGIAILRVVAPPSALGFNVLVSLLVAAGLAWIVRAAARGPRRELVEEEDEEDAPSTEPSSEHDYPCATLQSPEEHDSHPCATLQSPEYWLLLLAILPGAGMGLMTINNLGQIVSARGGVASTQRAATAIVSVANGLGRLGCGALADRIVARGRPRALLVVAADLVGALAMLVFYASGTSVPTALVAAALAGAAYGAIWTLIPTLAADLFGRQHFGSNYALILPSVSLAAILFSTVLAPAVYAAHADDDGCTGADCFGLTFLITAMSCGAGAVMALLLGVRSRGRYVADVPPESLLAASEGAGAPVV